MSERIVQDVPTDKPVSPGNVRARFDEEEQVSLAQSIAQNGIRVPLLGHYEGEPLIVDDGHRRLDAAKRVGLPVVPMLIADHTPTPAERITLQLVANTQRSGLKVTEHARSLNDLMQATGWPAAEVSVKLGGPSPSTISKLLSLLVHPREVQDQIDAGLIPMSSAYAIAIVSDAAERERLIGEVLSGRLTRDKLVAQTKASQSGRNVVRARPRTTVPRGRFVIGVEGSKPVAVSGAGLTLEGLAAWLDDLVARISAARAEGRATGDVIQSLSVKCR